MATVQRRVLGFLKRKGSFQFAPRCLSATADGVTTAKDHGRHKLSEVKGFSKIVMSTPPDVSLAHSVSADFQMSRGIAKEFKKKYGSVDELKEQGRSVGEVAVLKRDEGSFVYYLVTRERWWDPATPSAMRFSLLHLKKHCVENGVTKLAVPRLGSGEDRLDWPFVKEIIEDVFRNSDISITAYTTR